MANIFRQAKVSLAIVGFVWMVYLLNFISPIDFRNFGIRPWDTHGLVGIIFAPFIHANFAHIAANSATLFVFLWFALAYNEFLAAQALTTIILIAGLGTWVFGSQNSVHIGASSVIFGLFSYLLLLGWYRREWKATMMSIIVFGLYGTLIFALMNVIPGISWSGHFWGFVGGICAARQARRK